MEVPPQFPFTVGERTRVAEAPENIDWHELSQRSLILHQDLDAPNRLQAPVLESLMPNNKQDRNTATSKSRQAT